MSNLSVQISPKLPVSSTDTLSFETGASPKQVGPITYEHHGDRWVGNECSALHQMYQYCVLGGTIPTRFGTHRIQDIDTMTAIAIFLHRELIHNPNMVAWVGVVDWSHRWGLPAMSHLPDGLARFLSALRTHVPIDIHTEQDSNRLSEAIGWIRHYLTTQTIPITLQTPIPVPKVLWSTQYGTVMAETSGSLWDGWVELWRDRYLMGVLFSFPDPAGYRRAVIARKSEYQSWNAPKLLKLLNRFEQLTNNPNRWEPNGHLFIESQATGLKMGEVVKMVDQSTYR